MREDFVQPHFDAPFERRSQCVSQIGRKHRRDRLKTKPAHVQSVEPPTRVPEGCFVSVRVHGGHLVTGRRKVQQCGNLAALHTWRTVVRPPLSFCNSLSRALKSMQTLQPPKALRDSVIREHHPEVEYWTTSAPVQLSTCLSTMAPSVGLYRCWMRAIRGPFSAIRGSFIRSKTGTIFRFFGNRSKLLKVYDLLVPTLPRS